ncbi:S-layer homology domain-containing protein [Candidatus Saccharibacteria bacterium]|nr:S-layer homology domain-containing protein [Candidatus Saccharibacteria bacterium]
MRRLKKLVYPLVLTAMLLCLAALGAQPTHAEWRGGYFTDATAAAVNTAYELGIVHGDGSDKFRPNDTITMSEFAQMCYNAFGPPPAENTIGEWWEPAEWWLFGATVQPWYLRVDVDLYTRLCEVYGYDFDPDAPAPRGWAVNMLYLLHLPQSGTYPTPEIRDDALRWAADRGYAGFDTHDSFTRIEACNLILGLCELS